MSIRDEYDQVFRSLSRVELQRGADELDLPDLFGGSGSQLWLGFYTSDGLWHGLERYGLWELLAAIGYEVCRLELKCDDPDEHLLRIWSVVPAVTSAPLLELVARRDVLVPSGVLSERLGADPIGVLTIEWLQLQRPDADFEEDRPPLPGQAHPGLGIGREIHELLRQATKRLGLEAMVTVPSYFHNAYLYSAEYQYVDPQEQGLFLALCRDVLPRAFASLAAASWAIRLGMVVDTASEEKPFEWFHDVMICPVSERLRSYTGQATYQAEVCEALVKHSFQVLEGVLEQEMVARGIRPVDPARIAEWLDDERR